MKSIEKKKNKPTEESKPYHKPKILSYGSLKELTTGGSGHAQESSSGLKPRP